MRPVRDCWSVIESWLEANHEQGCAVLSPPATEEAVATVEETIGVDLPDAFVSVLRTHNGQTSDSRPLLRRYALLSTERIVGEWEQMTALLRDGAFEGRLDDFEDRFGSPDEEVEDVWWNDQWVPFARDASGNLLCLDLDPSPAGTRGQVIAVWHDMPTRPVRASSFQAWFSDYATAIEDGELVYSEQTHSMMADPDELDDLPAERTGDPTSEDIRALYGRHHDRLPERRDRDDVSNWFVEVCFEWNGDIGPVVQYQWGMVNAAALVDEGQCERAHTVFVDDGLTVEDEGDVFVTAVDPSLDAERAVQVTERVLADVYGIDIEDIAEIRERKL